MLIFQNLRAPWCYLAVTSVVFLNVSCGRKIPDNAAMVLENQPEHAPAIAPLENSKASPADVGNVLTALEWGPDGKIKKAKVNIVTVLPADVTKDKTFLDLIQPAAEAMAYAEILKALQESHSSLAKEKNEAQSKSSAKSLNNDFINNAKGEGFGGPKKTEAKDEVQNKLAPKSLNNDYITIKAEGDVFGRLKKTGELLNDSNLYIEYLWDNDNSEKKHIEFEYIYSELTKEKDFVFSSRETILIDGRIMVFENLTSIDHQDDTLVLICTRYSNQIGETILDTVNFSLGGKNRKSSGSAGFKFSVNKDPALFFNPD